MSSFAFLTGIPCAVQRLAYAMQRLGGSGVLRSAFLAVPGAIFNAAHSCSAHRSRLEYFPLAHAARIASCLSRLLPGLLCSASAAARPLADACSTCSLRTVFLAESIADLIVSGRLSRSRSLTTSRMFSTSPFPSKNSDMMALSRRQSRAIAMKTLNMLGSLDSSSQSGSV